VAGSAGLDPYRRLRKSEAARDQLLNAPVGATFCGRWVYPHVHAIGPQLESFTASPGRDPNL